jgi:hypothetical protein
MNPIYVPLLSALGGAIVGSLTSVATIYFQARINERGERLKQAVQLAIEDHKAAIEVAKTYAQGAMIPPLTAFMHYHMEVLDAMAKESLTSEALHKIVARNKAILKVAEEVSAKPK